MSTSKIEKLTPEQEALIPAYLEKWKAIALSTERIDRKKATEAVKAAYAFKGLEEPEIVFVESPFLALNKIADELIGCVEEHLNNRTLEEEQSKINKKLNKEFRLYLKTKLDCVTLVNPHQKQRNLQTEVKKHTTYEARNVVRGQLKTLYLQSGFIYAFNRNIVEELYHQLYFTFIDELEAYSKKCAIDFGFIYALGERKIDDVLQYPLNSPGLGQDYCLINFHNSVLNLNSSPEEEVYELLFKHCGWIFPFKTVCFVCDRPTQLSFDNQQRLHAEGEAAIAFSDGFSVYAYHGVRLPEKYGKIHPNQWQAKWLLEENNAELRRVLIQGVGYERICQELEAKVLDNWREYSLLKINVEVDVEPIYLLKMTCPSTEHIHALRVPPDMKTAKEAIRWVNWGIDPEEFSVET